MYVEIVKNGSLCNFMVISVEVLPVPSHNIDEYIKRLLSVVERLGYGEGLDYLR